MNKPELEKPVRNAAAIPSPSLLFYKDTILANIRKALAISGGPARLRPHVKTHKTREIIELERGLGIEKYKCATIAEAEMLGQAGAKDVIVAYPLVGPNVERFLKLGSLFPGTSFKAVVDDAGQAARLAEAARATGRSVETLLDLDPGLHRTGVLPGEAAVELYKKLAGLEGLVLGGLHCYDGQIHQADLAERTRLAGACYAAVKELQGKLEALGLPVPRLVLGGTPTFPVYAKFPEVELSPGTCFLQDWSYLSNYRDLDFAPAALILARVVSVNRGFGSFTLDLGYKAVSSDPQGARGIILNIDGAEPLFQNEEHWVFRKEKGPLPEIGEPAYVLPTHICPTVALHAEAYVVEEDGTCSSTWPIVSRARKLTV